MNSGYKFLLIGSVLLNVFLVGLISGHFMNEVRFEPRKGFCHKKMSEGFSPKSKALFEKRMSSLRAKDPDFHRQLNLAREEAFKVLVAKDFDAVAYKEKLENLRKLHDHHLKDFAEAIEEIAAQMPQHDRIVLAKSLRKIAQHRFRDH